MRLIRSICKRCIQKSLVKSSWNEWDEERWKRNVVFCVVKQKLIPTDKVEQICECKYATEQVVSNKG